MLKTEVIDFSITKPSRINLKPEFLIKSGSDIVPSPSTALQPMIKSYCELKKPTTRMRMEYNQSM